MWSGELDRPYAIIIRAKKTVATLRERSGGQKDNKANVTIINAHVQSLVVSSVASDESAKINGLTAIQHPSMNSTARDHIQILLLSSMLISFDVAGRIMEFFLSLTD